ncbi:MAG: hypothetical protein RBJ76_29200 [Stenomitos frigidus ULC029]
MGRIEITSSLFKEILFLLREVVEHKELSDEESLRKVGEILSQLEQVNKEALDSDSNLFHALSRASQSKSYEDFRAIVKPEIDNIPEIPTCDDCPLEMIKALKEGINKEKFEDFTETQRNIVFTSIHTLSECPKGNFSEIIKRSVGREFKAFKEDLNREIQNSL